MLMVIARELLVKVYYSYVCIQEVLTRTRNYSGLYYYKS